MGALLNIIDLVVLLVRTVLFWGAGVVAIIAIVDWCVRTRRINPFGAVARIFRSFVDPLLAPIERRIVRGGGLPANAPWWALGIVVVGGIILVSLLEYLRGILFEFATASAAGPTPIVRVLIMWTFGLLQLALLIRVISTWFRISPYSRWVRWAFSLTEWLLRPLRQVMPPFGMMDLTPLVAYFILSFLSRAVQSLIV